MADKTIALAAPKPEINRESAPDTWPEAQRAALEMWEPKAGENGKPELGTKKATSSSSSTRKRCRSPNPPSGNANQHKDKKAGPPEFSGAEPCKLTLELFFDATVADVNVVESVEKLFSCCVPCKETKGKEKPMPFLVVFKWGSVKSFAAYISQVQAKYTRFAPNGVPIRAVCTVNLEEIDVTPDPRQNPTSGSYAADSAHTMVTGDSLALVAYQEYGDPQLWRPLAAYNDIDDPMRIADGTRVLLPPLDTLLRPVG